MNCAACGTENDAAATLQAAREDAVHRGVSKRSDARRVHRPRPFNHGESAGGDVGQYRRLFVGTEFGVYFTPEYNGHHALVRPPLSMVRQGGLRDDVARITQNLARELEFLIRRAPEQWHLFQPNWPSDPGY